MGLTKGHAKTYLAASVLQQIHIHVRQYYSSYHDQLFVQVLKASHVRCMPRLRICSQRKGLHPFANMVAMLQKSAVLHDVAPPELALVYSNAFPCRTDTIDLLCSCRQASESQKAHQAALLLCTGEKALLQSALEAIRQRP